jgi:beta-lactamase class A
MTPSPTGKKRLKVGLPKNWSIAHKTGMGLDVLGVNTATKDVGVINSPSGQQFAIAVFISGSKAPIAQREQIMANIAASVVQTAQ